MKEVVKTQILKNRKIVQSMEHHRSYTTRLYLGQLFLFPNFSIKNWVSERGQKNYGHLSRTYPRRNKRKFFLSKFSLFTPQRSPSKIHHQHTDVVTQPIIALSLATPPTPLPTRSLARSPPLFIGETKHGGARTRGLEKGENRLCFNEPVGIQFPGANSPGRHTGERSLGKTGAWNMKEAREYSAASLNAPRDAAFDFRWNSPVERCLCMVASDWIIILAYAYILV